jgi:hypothetical protein
MGRLDPDALARKYDNSSRVFSNLKKQEPLPKERPRALLVDQVRGDDQNI